MPVVQAYILCVPTVIQSIPGDCAGVGRRAPEGGGGGGGGVMS